MNDEDYHKSLRPLEEACRLAGWQLLTCPLTGGKLMILLRHLSLVFKIYKIRDQRILVREFSNLPLLLVFPLLWPLRKKIYFLINHNLQWAMRDPLERFGLTLLAKIGARWGLFETQSFQGVENFGIPSERNLVLPHPVSTVGRTLLSAQKKEAVPVIGVAGDYRPEKGIDELIGLLKKINGRRDSRLPMVGILLGVPNPEAAAHLDVETVCTDSDEAYFEMISRCDVLVQNGAAGSYFYRASGPVADAAACGTAVVVPDFPMLGKQAAGIGEVFQTLETGSAGRPLPEAIRTAVEKAQAGRYDFDAYCAARSPQALAEILKRVANGTS